MTRSVFPEQNDGVDIWAMMREVIGSPAFIVFSGALVAMLLSMLNPLFEMGAQGTSGICGFSGWIPVGMYAVHWTLMCMFMHPIVSLNAGGLREMNTRGSRAIEGAKTVGIWFALGALLSAFDAQFPQLGHQFRKVDGTTAMLIAATCTVVFACQETCIEKGRTRMDTFPSKIFAAALCWSPMIWCFYSASLVQMGILVLLAAAIKRFGRPLLAMNRASML
jgi:hypothetical protein